MSSVPCGMTGITSLPGRQLGPSVELKGRVHVGPSYGPCSSNRQEEEVASFPKGFPRNSTVSPLLLSFGLNNPELSRA